MAFRVRFNLMDSRGRRTSRTYHNNQPLIATVLTDITTLSGLWDTITDLALMDVVITQANSDDAFAGAAVSNIDENTSVKALGADNRVYDVDLPDMPDAKHPIAALDVTDADVVAWFDEFGVANNWRVNLSNPTAITLLISGLLDK